LAHDGLPLTVLSPLLALLFNMPAQGYVALVVSLALGTPSVSAIGAIGAGLTLAVRRGGLILPLLVMPLIVPAVIFGSGAVLAAIEGLPSAAMGLLAAFSLGPSCSRRSQLRPRCGSTSQRDSHACRHFAKSLDGQRCSDTPIPRDSWS
jgi:heme exporter protein CcmB